MRRDLSAHPVLFIPPSLLHADFILFTSGTSMCHSRPCLETSSFSFPESRSTVLAWLPPRLVIVLLGPPLDFRRFISNFSGWFVFVNRPYFGKRVTIRFYSSTVLCFISYITHTHTCASYFPECGYFHEPPLDTVADSACHCWCLFHKVIAFSFP